MDNIYLELPLDKQWSRYKYFVMAKSYAYYKNIASLINDSLSQDTFNQYLSIIDDMDDSVGAAHNTFMHIWGYFKKEATTDELNRFKEIHKAFNDDFAREFLFKLVIKYKNQYLFDSYYFYELRCFYNYIL